MGRELRNPVPISPRAFAPASRWAYAGEVTENRVTVATTANRAIDRVMKVFIIEAPPNACACRGRTKRAAQHTRENEE